MSPDNNDECCPRFDPSSWNEKKLTWEDKRFVKDRVTSFLHIPLNFSAVMKRNVERIEKANAGSPTMMVLTDENSLWGADVYVETTKDVPEAEMASISGTFLAKAFEGPYRNVGKWTKEMKAFVEGRGQHAGQLYYYYTTCPKCAKKYGENYVVILAQI